MLESQAARHGGNFEAATKEIICQANVVQLGEFFLLGLKVSAHLQYTVDREGQISQG